MKACMRSNDFALIDKSIRRSSRISIQMYIIVYLYTLAQKVIVWLITLTFVGVCCAEEEYGSSTSESDEDEAGVTIVHCRSIDRESQSTNSEEVVKKELCISANVLRQSGIITLGATYSGIPNGFQTSLEVLSLQEVSTSGDNIKSIGHSYLSFSEQKFEISGKQDGYFYGLAVEHIVFELTLNNSANLRMHLYIFKEAGIITYGDETFTVIPGVVKLNLQISNWPFCGNRDIICEECHTYHVGKYLDLELALKGSSAAKKYDTDKTNGSRLSVESAEILFSQQVEKDDEGFSLMNTEDMLLGRIDSKHVVRLRFPMFAKQIVYDPYVEVKSKYNNDASLSEEFVLFN